MKLATAYQRNDRIFLHALSKTTDGVWILSQPVFMVDDINIDKVGELLLEVLESSSENVPHPKSWANLFDPILRLAKLKSWGTFVKSAKCVEVEFDGQQVDFIPTKNMGEFEGFNPIKEKKIRCSLNNLELQSALIGSFKSME